MPFFLKQSSKQLDAPRPDSKQDSKQAKRALRKRQNMLQLLRPPDGLDQLLRSPSDPVLTVLAKVDARVTFMCSTCNCDV